MAQSTPEREVIALRCRPLKYAEIALFVLRSADYELRTWVQWHERFILTTFLKDIPSHMFHSRTRAAALVLASGLLASADTVTYPSSIHRGKPASRQTMRTLLSSI